MAEKKIRLVYLMRKMVGGMQTHLLDLVAGLNRDRYDITVISPLNSTLKNSLDELDIPMVEVDIDEKINPYKDAIAVKKLKRVISSLRPDILHIHGNKTALVGRYAIRDMDIPAVIVTVHNFLIFQDSNFIMRGLAAMVERRLERYTDKLITVSSSLKRSLIEIEGISSEKLVTIPNGIDVESWKAEGRKKTLKTKLGLKEDDLLIASVGRFVPFKGHKILLEAAKIACEKRAELKVAIAGDGPLREELIALVDKLGLGEKVFFLGFVDDTRELFFDADMFVLPSLKEPFGIVVLEAMAASLPVIATRAGGVPDIIDQDEGILVEPGDPKELADNIIALAGDKGKRALIAEKALKKVTREFSAEKMVSRTEKVYLDCLDGRSIA